MSYDKYKDSNLTWLNKIPMSWRLERLERHCKIITGHPFNSDFFTFEGMPLIRIRDLKEKSTTLFWNQEYPNSAIIHNGDLLVGMDGDFDVVSWKGNHALLNQRILKIIAINELSNEYLKYILQFPITFINELTMSTTVKHLSVKDVNGIIIPIPTKREQNQIANYLDKKTSLIDNTLDKNKKLIQLLEEKRVALINQVVTKGLNPDVPMKDSGVEWIGEVPDHWDISRLKFLISKNAQYGANCEPESDETKFDYRYVRITDIGDDASLKDNIVYLSKDNAKGFVLNEGDILFARSGATVGKTYLYNATDGNCCFAGYLIRYVTNIHLLNPKYLLYFSFSKSYTEWIKIVSTQATIQNVSADKYDNLIISLPDIDEQNAIVSYLDNEISNINSVILKIKENITLLEEYKTSLIYHVVTGKIDVRGVEI